MKVIICGGRAYSDKDRIAAVLDHLHGLVPFTFVAHGAARGADTLGAEWATKNKLDSKPYPANWSDVSNCKEVRFHANSLEVYNPRAGLERNLRMLQEVQPNLVVAFPGGPGTAHMMRHTLKGGFKLFHVYERDIRGYPVLSCYYKSLKETEFFKI